MPDIRSYFLLLILFCILEAGNHFILPLCILKETMYLFLLAVLGLCCCSGVSSSCGKQVLLSNTVDGLLIAAASLVEHELSDAQASVALGHRLSSCGAWLCCSAAWGDLAGSGIKPVSPALAGGVLTTEPPGKPLFASLSEKILLSTSSPSQMSINMMVSYSKSQSKKHINGFQNIAIIENGSVQFSRSVVSDCLRPHGLQYARPPCPSPTPGIYPNSCPSSRWCHPTISSSVIPFSSRLQSFPASGSFLMSQFFTSGGQSIGSDYSL